MKFLNNIIKRLLPAALLLGAEVLGYANPEACSGQCWSHDPSVIRRESDGVYFRFETGSLIGIWKAGDLSGPWEYQGAVVPGGSIINLAGNDDLWAPDVHLVGDTYVLLYSVSSFGVRDSAIGYATSTTMEYGSWTDHGATGVASSDSTTYNAIDGNLIQDAAGAYYMNFGSFWQDIYQVPMDASGTTASGTPYNLAYNATSEHKLEGAFMHYRSGYYYLFFSSGWCCGYDTSYPSTGEEYKIFVGRSQSVSGPFVDANGVALTANGGTLVLASHDSVYGPGGQGIISDPNYGTVLYYHYANTAIGISDADYQFGWNVVSWSGGWPTV